MSSTRLTLTLVAALCFSLFPPACWSQDQSNAAGADSAAIRQVITNFSESFSHHDAHAGAMTFAEDADFTNMRGVHSHGREKIEKWLASLFRGNLRPGESRPHGNLGKARRTDIVRSIRFFTPKLAAVDADSVITGTKAADGSVIPPRKGLLIVVMTKQNGRWLISDYHEAEFPATPAAVANGPADRPTN
jgi:uncharacterized protein (TIGR02246 family)